MQWRINFTGENDPKKAPCPSTYFRPLETIEKWHGNVPMTPEQKRADDIYYAEITKAIEAIGKRTPLQWEQ